MKIKELMPLLKVHGRTLYDEEKQALYCNWSCSGFTVKLTGKQLRIKVQASSDQIPGMPNMPTPPPDWPCVGAIVNDELIFRHECLQNEEWITLWNSEETETVEVRVIKLSENARRRALLTHDADNNARTLYGVYQDILQS